MPKNKSIKNQENLFPENSAPKILTHNFVTRVLAPVVKYNKSQKSFGEYSLFVFLVFIKNFVNITLVLS